MKRWNGPAAASAIAIIALSGCHLYFEQGDDDDDDTVVAPDAGRAFSDAQVIPTPDADLFAPDAEPCETVAQFLTRFGDCMSFTDWQGTGMCDVPSETTSLGNCASCHSDGTGNITLSTNCQDTFDATRLSPDILGLVTPSADDAGCFNGFASGSWLTYSDPGHPTYTLSAAGTQAINDFFGFTFSRYSDPDFVCAP
jgi:hypothetical protein